MKEKKRKEEKLHRFDLLERFHFDDKNPVIPFWMQIVPKTEEGQSGEKKKKKK